MIGSLCAYSICLLISTQSCWCPMTASQLQLFVDGYMYLHQLLVNYVLFNDFLLIVSYSFLNLWETLLTVSVKISS